MSVKTLKSLLLMLVCVCMLATMATPALAWFGDWLSYPTGSGMAASGSACGYTYWYCWAHFTSCAGRNYWGRWFPGFGWNGRGWIHMDVIIPSANATSGTRWRYLNSSNNDNGQYSELNECALSCWTTPLDGYVGNIWDWNGVRIDMNENWTTCANECGYSASGFSVIHEYGDRYAYLNQWVILGPYSSTTIGSANGLDEANLYLYPYVTTTNGNTIAAGLWGGKVPFAYYPGDMNTSYSINFGTIWNQNPNQAAYAFAWVHCVNGGTAGPKFDIGSDDGERCWVNGGLITDTGDVGRGLTRDIDVTGGVGLSGWSRVLLKVQQGSGGGGWEGTVSLRNGGDNRQCEMSVDFQGDRYGGYSLYNEQDAWYPTMTLSNFDGVSSPAAGTAVYTNSTTVTANGTAAGQGPVPLWQVMNYQWGYGLSGAGENYTATTVSSSPWSQSTTGVTGHRRFHFFGVSRSGRTSGQASGSSGGWTWDASGHGNYCDVYVDNVAPVAPSLSTVSVVSASRIDLGWSIPNDNGVNVAAGSTETFDTTYGGGNYYRRGDVGVNVRRNTTSAYGWGTGTSLSDTGLNSNTLYAYDIAARDNTGESRGAWHNTGSYVGTTSVYTLAEAPLGGTNITAPTVGSYMAAAWPGVTSGSFGTGNHLITKFMYKWSASGSDSIAEGAGTNWTSGTMTTLPGTAGTWYLYVRSYNGATVGNGSTKFGPYEITYDAIAPTVTNVTVTPQNVGAGGDCLKGDLWVYADVEDNPGGTGIDTVEVMLTGGSWTPMTLKSGTTKTYEKQFTIDASSVNGARTASVRAKDLVGNITDPVVTKGYTVNKNEVSGEIALQGFRNNSTSRAVTFVLNGTISKPVTLTFVGGKVGYSFTDVPEITSISAKTAWTLRKKLGVTPVNGQSDMDFTGSNPLLGGDLNNDNVVNALDYSALRSAWGEFSVGDISGDGWTNNADYLVLKSNWYKKGEAQ